MKRQKRFDIVFRLSQAPWEAGIKQDIPCWRISGSGIHGRPEEAKWTGAITNLLESFGVVVERYCEGTPVNVDSHHLEAQFLDGGLYATTGNYWCSERGAWVFGARSALFLGLALSLRIPQRFEEDYHVLASLAELERELRVRSSSESVSNKNAERKPYFRFPDYAQLLAKLGQR